MSRLTFNNLKQTLQVIFTHQNYTWYQEYISLLCEVTYTYILGGDQRVKIW